MKGHLKPNETMEFGGVVFRGATSKERRWQRLSFAYGTLACSKRHRPTRQAFYTVFVEQMQDFTPDEFNKWADGLEWE